MKVTDLKQRARQIKDKEQLKSIDNFAYMLFCFNSFFQMAN